jgi:ubiquinone/menaquinone biosynthesis C-methylase UbiE
MKLNWAERLMVNNPVRVMIQRGILRWTKGKLILGPGVRVLEVGCGRGAGATLLLKEFQPAVLHAMDLDLKMIQRARAYLSEEQKDKISLYAANVLSLPYRDRILDAVFGFGVLHHVTDWRRALAEIARVLKPGGLYFLEEFYPPFYLNFLAKRLFLHPYHDRFFSHDLHRALREVGFSLKGAVEHHKLGILAVVVKEL